MHDPLSIALGFVPVVLFLIGLRIMDSYQLVPMRLLAIALGAGLAAALIAYGVNGWVLLHAPPHRRLFVGLIAPVIEESLKALAVLGFLRGNRVGFLVDAAILGFAVGAGFALAENYYYLSVLNDTSPVLWLVRGLGTAVMHGSTTAVLAILAKGIHDRDPRARARALAPGLALAVLVHATFNLLPFHPLFTTSALVLAMPIVLYGVFERSERATRAWLVTGFDSEVEMLEQILDQEVHGTRVGHYLEALQERFPPIVVADLLCLLRIHLELSLRAKGLLIARAAGLDLQIDDSVRANLRELRYLERSVGPIGKLAVLPLRRSSSRDLWQIIMLERSAGAPRPA